MKNSMIYPAKVRIVPNCKLVKVTSNRTDAQYKELLGGGNRGVVEKKNHKKQGNVVTKYFITNAEGYDNTDPLNFFDYSVLSVCISEIEEGNMVTTPAIILRGLTGKDNRENGNGKLHKDQRTAILNSIEKLMSTVITVDLTAANKALGYNNGKEEILTDTILPCHYKTEKVNGQVVDDTIIFDRQSLMFKVADDRNQVIRYDNKILDVPEQNNTPLVIVLKNYIILRVVEIKKHRQLKPILTLNDIFKKCRIADKHLEIKRRARDYIDVFFKHLQEKGIIKSFEWTKKGNKFYSVKFAY